MSKTESEVRYFCDRCGAEMGRPDRVLTFTKRLDDLWKPATWGKISKPSYDICEECFSSFFIWLHEQRQGNKE